MFCPEFSSLVSQSPHNSPLLDPKTAQNLKRSLKVPGCALGIILAVGLFLGFLTGATFGAGLLGKYMFIQNHSLLSIVFACTPLFMVGVMLSKLSQGGGIYLYSIMQKNWRKLTSNTPTIEKPD